MFVTLTIENENLIACFDQKGAELTSLKSKYDLTEYIWQADPTYWGRHAPVLFPIVGRLKQDRYIFQEKEYPMSQHGFARDMKFEVLNQTDMSITFGLTATPATLEIYPFLFELQIQYRLDKTTLHVDYQVSNQGEQSMYFSIGAHPAFNIPLTKGLAFDDYYITFSPRKSRIGIPLQGAFVDYQKRTLVQTNTAIDLNRELFQSDALIMETNGQQALTIESEKDSHSLTVCFNQMDFVGIWSPYPKEAPFVCIEPWCGIADDVNSSGNFVEKIGIQKLEATEHFTTNYCIQINEVDE